MRSDGERKFGRRRGRVGRRRGRSGGGRGRDRKLTARLGGRDLGLGRAVLGHVELDFLVVRVLLSVRMRLLALLLLLLLLPVATSFCNR